MAFLIATQIASPSEIGTYALAAAIGSIVTVGVQLGIDRAILVEVSHGSALDKESWRTWAKRRSPMICLCMLVALLALFICPLASAVLVVSVSRIVLLDAESVLVATNRLATVGMATIANALVSGPALIVSAYSSASLMVFSGFIGNSAALGILVAKSLRSGGNAVGRSMASSQPLALTWRECLPFAGMAIAAVIYQRADIAILGLLGVSAAALGSYAIALRAFEVIVAFRGAVVQHTAATWNDIRYDRSARWLGRIAILATGGGAAVIAASAVGAEIGLLEDFPDVWSMVGVIGAGLPLAAAHTVTSSAIYAHPGSVSTMGVSILMAGVSLLVTWGAVALGGVVLAAAAIPLKEYLSFVVFALKFKSQIKLSLALIAVWPICTAILSVLFWRLLV